MVHVLAAHSFIHSFIALIHETPKLLLLLLVLLSA